MLMYKYISHIQCSATIAMIFFKNKTLLWKVPVQPLKVFPLLNMDEKEVLCMISDCEVIHE